MNNIVLMFFVSLALAVIFGWLFSKLFVWVFIMIRSRYFRKKVDKQTSKSSYGKRSSNSFGGDRF